MRVFEAVRKDPDEFLAKVRPWKATNGVVCSDHTTKEEAVEAAERMNRQRGLNER